MSDSLWQVEVRNTDVGVMRGAWQPWSVPYAVLRVAELEAERLIAGCPTCTDRTPMQRENVRIVVIQRRVIPWPGELS